jgi:hypothetical protein
MPVVPEISAEFSAPPEFSGDVLEKELSTGSDLQITIQILLHCATASSLKKHCGMCSCFFCHWPQDFPAVSVFTSNVNDTKTEVQTFRYRS